MRPTTKQFCDFFQQFLTTKALPGEGGGGQNLLVKLLGFLIEVIPYVSGKCLTEFVKGPSSIFSFFGFILYFPALIRLFKKVLIGGISCLPFCIGTLALAKRPLVCWSMKYPLLPLQPYNWEPSLQLGFGARERGGRAGANGWQGVFNTGASADQQKQKIKVKIISCFKLT